MVADNRVFRNAYSKAHFKNKHPQSVLQRKVSIAIASEKTTKGETELNRC
jgi:hypothetical protein